MDKVVWQETDEDASRAYAKYRGYHLFVAGRTWGVYKHKNSWPDALLDGSGERPLSSDYAAKRAAVRAADRLSNKSGRKRE